MISESHLKRWIEEIRYQLQGLMNEVATEKVEDESIKLPNGKTVSFEYLQEKIQTIAKTINCIEYDIKTDGTERQDDLPKNLKSMEIFGTNAKELSEGQIFKVSKTFTREGRPVAELKEQPQ